MHKLPNSTKFNLREMEERDIVQVTDLFAKYMARFDMVPIMNIEELRHQFLSGRGAGEVVNGRRQHQVVWAFVLEVHVFFAYLSNITHQNAVQHPETEKITDFVSFYVLPSTVIGNTKYPVLDAAYLYYYASDLVLQTNSDEFQLTGRLRDLIGDAVILANNANFDVFNALTLMDNMSILKDLKVMIFLSNC
jgi:glycylpeptide N-tetradecanoyltransferase